MLFTIIYAFSKEIKSSSFISLIRYTSEFVSSYSKIEVMVLKDIMWLIKEKMGRRNREIISKIHFVNCQIFQCPSEDTQERAPSQIARVAEQNIGCFPSSSGAI